MADEKNLNIVLNDSFSGSTICNTVREEYAVDSSFVSRIEKYIANGFLLKIELIVSVKDDVLLLGECGIPIITEVHFVAR